MRQVLLNHSYATLKNKFVHKSGSCMRPNDLVLNTDKTKELILDFRRRAPPLQPLTIKGIEVERTDAFTSQRALAGLKTL